MSFFPAAVDDWALVLADKLVKTLPSGLPTLFNPWVDVCPLDMPVNTPQSKLLRLGHHLNCDPQFILVGEAPGYQGCRHSGVAFTSERLLLEGAIPRVPQEVSRLTSRRLPYSEPSATIVWKTLYHLGVANQTILWNALQMHPHKPGVTDSNRTPTEKELAFGAPALQMLTQAFPSAKVVAVGNNARDLLTAMGIGFLATVRHPANGGATQFSEGLAALIG